MSLYPSLNLSPGRSRTPETRRQKAEKFGFFEFFLNFFAFRSALQKWLPKNIEKLAKIKDFGFRKPIQNRPKKLSKSKVQKTSDFSSIFYINLTYFFSRFSWKYAFSLEKIINFRVRSFNSQFEISSEFSSKNHQKNLPKRRLNPSNIDAKNVLFFNIDFFGFRPRFQKVLGVQLGIKLAILAPKNYRGCPPEPT